MQKLRAHALMLGSLAAVLLAYANSFGNTFHFDDFHTVTDNPAIRSLRNIPKFFTDTTTFSVLPANRTYRPTVSTSLAVDYSLGRGYTPFWFHLSTMLLFLLLIWLVAKLAETMYQRANPEAGPTPWISTLAVVAAAWYGLHPAMAETVNYIIQRGDLYCTLGCVAALVIYARRWSLAGWRGVYLLPLVFALLSKPPAAVFPLLLFCWVWLFEEVASDESRLKRAGMAVIPSLLVVVAGLILQSAMTPKTFKPSELSATDYRMTQPFVWLRYFGELFLPIHLNVDSDLEPFGHVNGRLILGLIFVVLVVVTIVLCWRRQTWKPVAFGLTWFVITQLPTSAYALSEVENDHRMFFSFAVLIPAVVWGFWIGLRHLMGTEQWQRAKPILAVAVVLGLFGYAWGTHVRNAVWHTEESLWQDDVQKSPNNGRGLMIYGLTQMSQGRYPLALSYFTRALEFTPNYPTLEINLGVVYGAMGNATEAERHFLRSIALAPGDDQTHAFYGRWLASEGRTAEAAAQLAEAHTLNPTREAMVDLPAANPAATALNASLAAYQRGDYAASILQARKALDADPKSASAWNNIGAAEARLGLWKEAVEADGKALELDPSLQIAKNNLAEAKQHIAAGADKRTAAQPTATELLNRSLVLYQAGQFEASAAAAKDALKLQPNLPEAWNNLAAADASLKRWDAAISAAQRAVALKPDFQLARNNLAWAESEKAKLHAR